MSQSGHETLTQETYTEIPYADAEWDIVGQPPSEQLFTPAPIEVVKSAKRDDDPVFASYGGYSSQKGKVQRWHLPEELAATHVGSGEDILAKTERMVLEHAAALEVMETRARESGHKQAMLECAGLADEKVKVVTDKIAVLIDDLRRQLDERREEVERQAVELAVNIAQQLTRATVEYNPEYILPIIKAGLDQVSGAVVKCVKVSKDDLEFLTLAGSLVGLEGAGTAWKFIADDSIKSGCIVETASGEIDMQIDAAFERVKAQVLRAVK